MKNIFISLASLFSIAIAPVALSGVENDISAGVIYDGQDGSEQSISAIAESVTPGSIVILSEIHNSASHHENQAAFLKALQAANPDQKISVGMEFFYVNQKEALAKYLDRTMTEEAFLAEINWGGFSYDFYRELVNFPIDHSNGTTLALNAPQVLTKAVARVGIENISDELRAMVPENFTLGNDNYFQRFKETMTGGGHELPDDVILRYFTSQSLWDEQMAVSAINYLEREPEAILVIMVGDFHASYFGGLPSRLEARGASSVTVISQALITDETSTDEARAEVDPDPRWGSRANYIWVSQDDEEIATSHQREILISKGLSKNNLDTDGTLSLIFDSEFITKTPHLSR